jgi:hypothetical protein
MEDTSDRFQDIDEAFPSTFDWIWTNTSLKFDDWLRNGERTYWISGKPGSGKSTLMKLICTSNRTQSALDWRSSSRILKQVTARFFFLNRGSYNQKSLYGLRQSLLHQILLADSRLIKVILPVFDDRSKGQGRYWSDPDLERAFIALRDQKLVAVDILLTLDAIDEYDGPPEKIVDFIRTVTTPTGGSASLIRVCFSSRLWEQFDQFKKDPGFQIDEHTEQDLREYINGRLRKNDSTSSLTSDVNLLTFSDWIATLVAKAEGVKDRDFVLSWIKSRCGGMIELDPKDGLSPQFMHKSVKDFVAKAGFQWRILRPSYVLSGQNGHSFLARYGLALLLASFKRQDPIPSPASWNQYLSHARQAEATTGKTQKELFYEVSDEVFRWVGAQEDFRYYYSMLSYAVTADLRLFVKASFEDGRVADDPSMKSLLHCVVDATISHSSYRSRSKTARPQKATFPNLSTMVEDLLERGVDRNSAFGGMTPFQLLFSDCFEGFGDGRGSVITENMLKVAKVFLDAGQDSNTPIRVTVRWWQRRHVYEEDTAVTCTPLHVASSMEMVKLLLSYKASINALDSNNNTPLDIYLGEEDKLEATGEDSSQIPAYRVAALILSKGGCVNRTSQKTLDTFATVFQSQPKQGLSTYATSKELKKPPRLKTKLFSGIRKLKAK